MRKNIYFVFDTKKECEYYFKNVACLLDDDMHFYKDKTALKIERNNSLIRKVNIFKRIWYLLRYNIHNFNIQYDIDNVAYNFINVKNFSAENKDMNNVYYIKKDNKDYTDYIMDIMTGIN